MTLREFKKDWRNNGQLEVLFGKELILRNYKNVYEITKRDHEHCRFCWGKISIYSDSLQQGYCDCNMQYWVCPQCYEDFKAVFQWRNIE